MIIIRIFLIIIQQLIIELIIKKDDSSNDNQLSYLQVILSTFLFHVHYHILNR